MKASEAITDAFVECGRAALGNPLDSDNLAHGLRLLNRIIDQWKVQSLYIPYTTEIVQNVTGSPITIGTGGTINTTRPSKVLDTSFFRISGIDYPIQWLTQEVYNLIGLKDIDTIPRYGWLSPGLPLSSLYFYPQPINYELHLRLNAALPAFADYDTDYLIEDGYQDAIILTLAVAACRGFREVPRDLERDAATATRVIKTRNSQAIQWPDAPISKGLGNRYTSPIDFLAGY